MAALESQIIDAQEFSVLDDYNFLGDNSTLINKRAFIMAYREEGSVYHAAKVVGIHRSTVYKWMDADQSFVQAVADSHEDSVDMAETSAFKKALAGDSLLLMFYLKAHRPKFRDRVSIDLGEVQAEIQSRIGNGQLALPAAIATTTPNDDNSSS